ncbi:MAG TPA: amidohydrolase [Albidovulum sp.]|uniref:amidohydrolase family protein n=1 Tax=Albidovulum sp. TaxID=1872424 RepID=UPI002BE4E884|nr:amidohydrolase [Albidovulum sp.]
MDFIDTHQHLIWRDRLGYGWTAGIPALATGDFTPEDYQAQITGLGIAGTIFMECGVDDADHQAEARYVATRVGRDGILGQIASCRPETDDGFDEWLEECGGLHVKGFRRILHVVPDEMSQTPTFRRNLKKIGQKGLAFDMCFLARQLPIAEELARACDGQALVLDHCGVPDIAGGAFDDWATGIDRLAALPHVSVKLSGISAYCAPGTASTETLRPWVDHVIARFGADRVVWGSDWPVVLLGSGLVPWIEITRALLSPLSPGEQAAIASRNARRIYGV